MKKNSAIQRFYEVIGKASVVIFFFLVFVISVSFLFDLEDEDESQSNDEVSAVNQEEGTQEEELDDPEEDVEENIEDKTNKESGDDYMSPGETIDALSDHEINDLGSFYFDYDLDLFAFIPEDEEFISDIISATSNEDIDGFGLENHMDVLSDAGENILEKSGKGLGILNPFNNDLVLEAFLGKHPMYSEIK